MLSVHRSLAAAAAVGTLLGCSKPARNQSEEILVPDRTASARAPASAGASVAQRKAELLNRIRAADPQQATIERALLNEKNELGLIMNRQTNLDDLPKLMRTMLAEMDKTFPGQDHTVIAYTPTNPPHTIGTAHLDSRTRDMTYTPASR